jgi:tetratricopeptide (TPR) repeat protein
MNGHGRARDVIRVHRCELVKRLFPRVTTMMGMLAILLAPLCVEAQSVDKGLETVAELIRQKRMDEAERQLANILKRAPNDALAMNLLGTIRAQQGKLNDAESYFLRAIRIDGQLIGARMNLAYLYSLRKEPDKTIVQLEDVLRIDATNQQALDMLARLLLAQGQIDKGIEILERAKQSAALSSSLLVLLGDAYLRRRNADKAEESFQSALSRQSDDTDAVLGLAQVSQFRGDGNAALAYLSRARKLPAVSPGTLYRFAMTASGAGLYEEANKALEAAIKLKPDDAGYYIALGNTWIKKPDLFEAEKAFRMALRLDDGNPQAQMSLGYALLEQKKYPEAQEWLEKSLLKDRSVPETFYYLGQIAQEQNEDERAIELFKSAIQLAPDYSFPHAGLGSSYLKLKNYPLARQELELSVKLNPNDAKAHYGLAVLYARLKEPERAQQEMRIVEQLKKSAKSQQKEDETIQPSQQKPR